MTGAWGLLAGRYGLSFWFSFLVSFPRFSCCCDRICSFHCALSLSDLVHLVRAHGSARIPCVSHSQPLEATLWSPLAQPSRSLPRGLSGALSTPSPLS